MPLTRADTEAAARLEAPGAPWSNPYPVPRSCRPLLPAALAALALAAPATASAHLRTGTTAVDDTATVTWPTAASGVGLAAGVYASDLALHLTALGHHSIVVIGYLGEPFLRVSEHGVAVNTGSPTAAAAGLLKGLPRSGDASEGWRLLSRAHSAVWHDSRVAPNPRNAPWRIPILLDGHRAQIVGRARRYPRPRLWLWLVPLATLCLLVLRLRTCAQARVDQVCILAGAVAAAASLTLSAGFVISPYASAGTWIAAVDEAVFLAVAAAATIRAPPRFRALGGASLGLVALAVTLSKGAIFLHPVVLSTLPGTLSRALAFAAAAAGTSAVVLGPFHLLNYPGES